MQPPVMVLAFSLAAPLPLSTLRTSDVYFRSISTSAASPLRVARTRLTLAKPPSVPSAPPAPPEPAAPVQLAQIQPPPGAYAASVALGSTKAAQPPLTTLLLGVVAGAYIAAGALLALSVAGSSPALAVANPGLHKFLLGAIGLPTGLTLVVAAGGDLFTGNTMLLSAALLQGKASFSQLLGNWVFAYIGNFMGALTIAAAVVSAGVVSSSAVGTVSALAVAKCALPFWTAFLRGVLCNWLVCLGVYLATASSDFGGKFGAVLITVSLFVALGLDHSVANMFFIPLAMLVGAEVSMKGFLLGNLLPVTLGNIIGGAVLVAGVYNYAFGKKMAKKSMTIPRDAAPRMALAKE